MASQAAVEHYTELANQAAAWAERRHIAHPLPAPAPWAKASLLSAPTVAALPVTETVIKVGAATILVRVEYDIGESETWECPATHPFVSSLDCLVNGAWVDAHDVLSDAAIEQAERLTLEWMQGGC